MQLHHSSVFLLALLCQLGSLAQELPLAVRAALARAQVPLNSVSVLVQAADGKSPALLSHRATARMNPASVTKLVTTFAALELLGPAYSWHTPVWLNGPVEPQVGGGVLQGDLVIQGQGDPKLVLERIWLLLRRVQALGVQKIAGDMLLDRSAFAGASAKPADFDGAPLRPYNVQADALLLNFKSVLMTFSPEPQNGIARVQYSPLLAGVQQPTSVPLLASQDAPTCGDYRASLGGDFSNPLQWRFTGSYPASCGEKVWPLAFPDAPSYDQRLLEGLWRSMGGQLSGRVRDGLAPTQAASFELVSPTLAELIRDINKFSNNVMAEQLFLSLASSAALGLDASADLRDAASRPQVATPSAARGALRRWWQSRFGEQEVPVIENGSGLSRQTRISAQALAQLLQAAYASPLMPELLASLPIVGVDGTLKRSAAPRYSAHLKTGSLRDVLALAGFVHAPNGAPLIFVAIVNHGNASAARPALDALLAWSIDHTALAQ